MKISQVRIVFIPLVIFGLTLVLKIFSSNLIPEGMANAQLADTIFYYSIQIIFWFSTAFLLNRIIIISLWEGVFVHSVKSGVPRFFSDLISVSVYISAFNLIYVLEFNQSFDNKAFTFTVIFLVLGTAFRHKVVNFFNSITINTDRPYNISDWIEIILDSGERVLGQVIDINRRTTRLRTEGNSIIVFPNILLNNYIINNFSGSGLTGRFDINICLDYSIDTNRAKRILMAGAKQASFESGFLKSPEPEVIIENTTEMGVNYKILYWITPWEGIAPSSAANLVYSNIIEHLTKTGLAPAYPKQVMYNTEMPITQVDYRFVPDKKEILSKIEIFHSLSSNELSLMADDIKKAEYSKNSEIIKHNSSGSSMFILIEGLLDVYIEKVEDENLKVAQLVPGDFFGEMSLLTGEKRSATVIALTDVVVFEITKSVFEKLIKQRPEIIEEIGEIIEKRQTSNIKKLAESEHKKESLINKIKKFFHI